MLVLSRGVGQEIVIAGNVRIRIGAAQRGRVQLLIDAPSDISVHRSEVFDRLMAEQNSTKSETEAAGLAAMI